MTHGLTADCCFDRAEASHQPEPASSEGRTELACISTKRVVFSRVILTNKRAESAEWADAHDYQTVVHEGGMKSDE